MYIASNIRCLRKKLGLSQPELAEMLGYKSFTTIQKWESGVSTPPLEVFSRMASLFETDMDDLARRDLSVQGDGYTSDFSTAAVPVYGRIPAGIPVEAITNIEEYAPLSEQMRASRLEFFALKLHGSSMSPKYLNDDIVIFEKRNRCENGEDCAVRLSGEDATFKKVIFEEGKIILKPLNPEYMTVQFDSSKADSFLEIIGVAREIRRAL